MAQNYRLFMLKICRDSLIGGIFINEESFLGFGLLESGCVSKKNEVNIMVKNVADVVLGGLSYWVYGYGLQFGEGEYTNWFCGWGKFFLDDTSPETMGMTFANFIFHVSDIIGFRKYI